MSKTEIRVFEIMKQQGNTLYFTTAPRKEVYRQLQENPNVEILAMKENIFVRIAGQAVFDVDDMTARDIYAANPVLPRLYKAYTDLAYFRLNRYDEAGTELYRLLLQADNITEPSSSKTGNVIAFQVSAYKVRWRTKPE